MSRNIGLCQLSQNLHPITEHFSKNSYCNYYELLRVLTTRFYLFLELWKKYLKRWNHLPVDVKFFLRASFLIIYTTVLLQKKKYLEIRSNGRTYWVRAKNIFNICFWTATLSALSSGINLINELNFQYRYNSNYN